MTVSTNTPASATAGPQADVPSRYRWTGWLLVAVTWGQVGLVLAQAALAGDFLSGGTSALSVHEMLGTEVLTAVTLVQFVAAVLVWRPGRRSAWPMLVVPVLFGLLYLQIEWGFGGRLSLHVPNALVILSGQFLVLWLARRPRLATGRAGR